MSKYSTAPILDRPVDAAPVPFYGPLTLRPVDSMEIDDDEIIDGWLATLTPNELEGFLSFLAASPAGSTTAH